MKNKVNMHPVVFAITLVIAGIAGAGIVNMLKVPPPPIGEPIVPECPPYQPVGQAINFDTADVYYKNYIMSYGPQAIKYITLSLDDFNDMAVVKQNATNGSIDLKAFRLYYGLDGKSTFLMVSGITASGNLTKPIYKLVPDDKIGPCPDVCDASGLPPIN